MFRLYVDNDLILKIGLYFHDGFDIYDRLPVRPEKFIGISLFHEFIQREIDYVLLVLACDSEGDLV